MPQSDSVPRRGVLVGIDKKVDVERYLQPQTGERTDGRGRVNIVLSIILMILAFQTNGTDGKQEERQGGYS